MARASQSCCETSGNSAERVGRRSSGVAAAALPLALALAACGGNASVERRPAGVRPRPQPASGDQLAVAFSGDSRRIAFAGADGVVREWKLGAPEPHVVGQPGSPVIALAWVRSHGETALAAGGLHGVVFFLPARGSGAPRPA